MELGINKASLTSSTRFVGEVGKRELDLRDECKDGIFGELIKGFRV